MPAWNAPGFAAAINRFVADRFSWKGDPDKLLRLLMMAYVQPGTPQERWMTDSRLLTAHIRRGEADRLADYDAALWVGPDALIRVVDLKVPHKPDCHPLDVTNDGAGVCHYCKLTEHANDELDEITLSDTLFHAHRPCTYPLRRWASKAKKPDKRQLAKAQETKPAA